jgi:MFS family permease
MRRLLILACSVVFLEVAFFSVLTPLLPDYRSDLGLSEAGVGLLSGSFAAGTLVAALPAGWFVARFNSRRAVLIGLVGMGIFSPIFGFAEQTWLLDLSRFFQGASGAMLWAGAISWVVSAGPPEQRGSLVGTVIAAAVVGELTGAPLGVLAHQIGTEIVFSSVFLLAIILGFMAWSIPSPSSVESQRIDQAVDAARGSGLLPSILLLAAPSFAFGLIVVLAPLRMDDLGATPLLIAAAFAAGSVAEAVVGPLVGRYSDRVGRTGPYLVGIAIVAVAIAVVGIFADLTVIFVAVIFIAFGSGIAFTPASTLIADVAAAAGLNQGYASGAANVAWGGGQMLGAIGAGVLTGLSGYLLPALITVFVLGATGTVARSIAARAPAEAAPEPT